MAMKKPKFIIFILSIVALSACVNNDNLKLTAEASVINNLESTDFILPDTTGNQNIYLFRLNWTKTKFFSEAGSPVYVDSIKYSVEADLNDNNFTNPVVIASTTSLYSDIYTETLRTLLYKLAGATNQDEQTVSIRIKSVGNNMIVYSDPVLITISPFILSGLTIVSGNINDIALNSYNLQNPGTTNPVLFNLSWAECKFYIKGTNSSASVSSIKYKVQLDVAGNQFSNAQTLVETSSLSADIYTKDLNQLLIDKFQANSSATVNLEMRLLIEFVYKGASGSTLSDNVINLQISPYINIDPLQPMYIIGDLNNWDNTDTNGMLIMFKDNQNSDNYSYTYTGYMPVGNYKFLPEVSLGTYKAYCFKETGKLQYLETTGNAFYNATAGYKTISINIQNMTYNVSDYNVTGATDWSKMGLVGSFNGWTDTEMTRLSNDNRHIWILNLTLPALTSSSTHTVKFRANGSWDYRWAPADPESAMYGKTIFLKSPDDNVVIREGGNYHIVFNDLSGHYIFLKE